MQDTTTEKVEDPQKDFGFGGQAEVRRWKTELKLADKNEEKWVKRGEKVMKRYRDEREAGDENDTKFNILWANTQTLIPALYMHTPKPICSRRFKDKNQLAVEAASLLERATAYSVDSDICDFDDLMESAVEDYQLPGRAVTRVVYKPYMVDRRFPVQPIGYEMSYQPNYADPQNPIAIQGDPIYPEGTQIDEVSGEGYETRQVVDYEEVYGVHVYWKDFRMGKARSWKKTPWAGFRSYLNRKELHDRFDDQLGADVVDKIPLNHNPDKNTIDSEDNGVELLKKAEVWEIWDRTEKKVIWICPDWDESPLDKDDPHLNLHNFYPCTPPMIMTKTTGSMIPVPEYTQYQDQATELDELTVRISLLVEAVRVTGVYDANAAGVEKILTSSAENKLYPLKNFAKFKEKGGVEGAIAWLPLDNIITTLRELYAARERIKQDLYEITGIADIVRGASDPRETMGAQKLKGRWVAQRLSKKQNLVAKHAKAVITLMAEVIAEQFSPETLNKITGLQPSEEVIQLLRNDPMRTFMIDIETDSTIAVDEEEEKRSRVEFLNASSEFLVKAIELTRAQPLLTPLLGEMLMFGVRGFRAGRDLEDEFERTMETIMAQLEQQMSQQQNRRPPEDPAVIKAKTDSVIKLQSHLQDMAFDQQEHDQEMQQNREAHQQNMSQSTG